MNEGFKTLKLAETKKLTLHVFLDVIKSKVYACSIRTKAFGRKTAKSILATANQS